MIDIIDRSANALTREVVTRAFERSFTKGQIRVVDDASAVTRQAAIVVIVAPRDDDAAWIEQLAQQRSKIMILGSVGDRIAGLAGIMCDAVDERIKSAAECAPAPTYGFSESAAAIIYSRQGLGAASGLRRRLFCRFDFTNEWNNLGYGRTGFGGDLWSIAATARPTCATSLAHVTLADQTQMGSVVTLRELPHSAVLWFARPAGPIDGPDWAIVEHFISDYRTNELPWRPHLRDIPEGVASAVTMRLDCDEDIASSRPLFNLYRARGLPLSVAVKTDQPDDTPHLALLSDLQQAGGSILSHSATHALNWGGSTEAAEREGRESKAWLESRVAGLKVRYAVSPFHQNPNYLPYALARAGYNGFVGGIIANDPEYLMARGGTAPFSPSGFISHSQTCMLHGDCMLAGDDPIQIYKEAFLQAKASGQFFGYLDHPFSSRYAYGWASEADRLTVHAAFLDFIAQQCAGERLLFVNEETCLDFMLGKAETEIVFDTDRETFAVSRSTAAGLPLAIGARGHIQAVGHG